MNAKLIISILIAVIIVFLSCSDNNTDPFANAIWFGKSEISGFKPDNNSKEIKSEQEFQIIFSDSVMPGSGFIRLYSDKKLIQSLNVKTDLTYDQNKAKFHFTTPFGINTRYYILIDKEAFKMSMNRVFEGLKDTSDWNFTSESLKNKKNNFTVQISKASGIINVVTEDVGAGIMYGQMVVSARFIYGSGFFEECIISIVFPVDIQLNTDYNLSVSANENIYRDMGIQGSTYNLETGKLRLLHYDVDYIEGQFNFTAKSEKNDTMNATNGYFFLKKE